MEIVTILSISPLQEDHVSLARIIDHSEVSFHTASVWEIHPTDTLESAVSVLRKNGARIVLTERDLIRPGAWKDVLMEISALSDPPLLIVTSRLADEFLWAEALNLGAFDVLAKPFDSKEAIHVLISAWLRKENKNKIQHLAGSGLNSGVRQSVVASPTKLPYVEAPKRIEDDEQEKCCRLIEQVAYVEAPRRTENDEQEQFIWP